MPLFPALLLTALPLVLLILLIRALSFGERIESPIGPASAPVDRAAAAERLAEILRYPTLSWPEPERFDREAFLGLQDALKRAFPRVHASLSRESVGDLSLLYCWPGSDPALLPVLLMAHQDVVPVAPGTEGDWTHPPFGGEISGGYIWGRGALDVKSALTGILEAVETLLGEGFRPVRTVYFAFGHDEEVGGRRGNARIAALLTERGIRLEYVLDEGGQIAEGIVPGLEGAAAFVGIAEKGFVNIDLIVRGSAGHSSMPPQEPAAAVLGRALARLADSPFPVRLDFTARMFSHLGRRLSFGRRFLFSNLWLFAPVVSRLLSQTPKMNASLRTTVAPTLLKGGIKENVLPAEVSATLNVRIIPGDSISGAVEGIRQRIGDSRVQVVPRPGGSEPSAVSSVDSTAWKTVRDTILEVAGDVSVAPFLVVGATDSRYFAPLSQNVFRFLCNRLGPEDLKRIHGTDERISVDNYAEAVTFYYRLLVNTNKL